MEALKFKHLIKQLVREAMTPGLAGSGKPRRTVAAKGPTCEECGKKLTSADKNDYEAEGGSGYPRICMDCGEDLEAADRASSGGPAYERSNLIAPEEIEAWIAQRPFQDLAGKPNVQKFSDMMAKRFNDREPSGEAMSVLYQRYPKIMASLEKA